MTRRRTACETARRVRDLPPGRLENLVWHYAYRQGLSLDTELGRLPGQDCAPRMRCHPPTAQAILGDDGFVHLWRAGRIRCRHHTITPRVAEILMNQCPDVQATKNEYGAWEWRPLPVGEPTEAIEVPLYDQCPSGRTVWPGTIAGTGRRVAVRRAVVEEFGPGCMCCDVDLGCIVDHDHLTGLVRGYLCRDCNGAVDHCWHLDECRFARYLNSAPALTLSFLYPDASARLRSPKYVGRRRQYDLVMAGGISEGVGIQDPEWLGQLMRASDIAGGTTGAHTASGSETPDSQDRA